MGQCEFLNNFFNVMRERNIVYTEDEQQNFKKLLNALENKEVEQVQIFNIPMGLGKSTFIKEYCKYKLETDKNFSICIVNKTIKECIETCVDIGLREEFKKNYKDLDKNELFNLYRGKLGNGRYKKFPNPEYFNAVTVNGFNNEDCLIYSKYARDMKEKPLIVDEKKQEELDLWAEFYIPLDNSLCVGCKNNCLKNRVSRIAKNNRIVLISHNRLLNSNDSKSLLKDVLFYENEQGERIKRRLLVIDEKLNMVDIKSVTMKNIIKLKEFIERNGTLEDITEINNLYNKIQELDFASGRNMKENKIKHFFSHLSISKEIKKQILGKNKTMNETLAFLENLCNFDLCITYETFMRRNGTEKRELMVGRYIDLLEYVKQFGNIILLDATADVDVEYEKSKIKIQSDIVRNKKKINLYIPINKCNLSKSLISDNIKNKKCEIIEKMAEECDEIINRTNQKTLIVVYKSVNPCTNFKKMLTENLSSSENMYKVIHFGEKTTGVNYLSEYENIIFLGQLRKTPAYYLTKSLVLEKQKNKYTPYDIQNNEMLVDTIQQIGRTAYRKGIIPNVYIFDNEEITEYLRQNLSLYFDVIEQDYNNDYLYVERKEYEENERDIKSYFNKFLEYLLYYLAEEANSRHFLDNKYTFSVNEIKKIINYKSKNFGRDVVQNLKKNTTDKFIIYDKRKAEITVNLTEL